MFRLLLLVLTVLSVQSQTGGDIYTCNHYDGDKIDCINTGCAYCSTNGRCCQYDACTNQTDCYCAVPPEYSGQLSCDNQNKAILVGIIVVSVIGGIVGIVLICLCCYCCWINR
jgi:hypothetical protein